MELAQVIDWSREALRMALVLGGPPLGVALVVGLVVGIAQTLTQLHEPVVGLVPRLIAVVSATPNPAVELTMALVHPGKALPARVQRLVGWSRPVPPSAGIRRATYAFVVIGAGACAMFSGPLLAGAHAATEWLVAR